MDENFETPSETESPAEPILPPVTPLQLTGEALRDLLAGVAVGVGTIAIGGLLYIVLGGSPNRMISTGWGIAILLLGTQIPLLVLALRRRRRNRAKQRPVLGLFNGAPLKAIVRGITAGFGLAMLSGFYTIGLQLLLGPDAVDNQVEFLKGILDDQLAVALLVFIITVVAPVCEETFFRGVVFGSAHASGFTRTGAALSAVLFAAVHLVPLLAPFYAIFALVMCWLYVRTGTLLAPIAAHMAMNGLAVASFLAQSERIV